MRQKTPLSYIELSEKNLIHNIKQFKNLAKEGTKFSVAIKGNAYGHGQKEIIKILEPYVDYSPRKTNSQHFEFLSLF